jgi:hypothetical protein
MTWFLSNISHVCEIDRWPGYRVPVQLDAFAVSDLHASRSAISMASIQFTHLDK